MNQTQPTGVESEEFLSNLRSFMLQTDRDTQAEPSDPQASKRHNPVYLLQSNELVTEDELFEGLAKIGA